MFQWHKTIFRMFAILEGNLAIHLYQVKALKCLYGKFLIKRYKPKLLQFCWLWLVIVCCVLSCTCLYVLKRWSFAVVNWFLLGELWNWFGCIHLYSECKCIKLYCGILYTCVHDASVIHDASVKCVIAVPVSIQGIYWCHELSLYHGSCGKEKGNTCKHHLCWCLLPSMYSVHADH